MNNKQRQFRFKIPKISEVNYEVLCDGNKHAGEFLSIPLNQWPKITYYDIVVDIDSLENDSLCTFTISNSKQDKQFDFNVSFCVQPKRAEGQPVALVPESAQLGVPTKIVFQLLDSKNVEFQLKGVRYDDSTPLKCLTVDECKSYNAFVTFTDTGRFDMSIDALTCSESPEPTRKMFESGEIEIKNEIIVEAKVSGSIGYIFIRKSFEGLQSVVLYGESEVS